VGDASVVERAQASLKPPAIELFGAASNSVGRRLARRCGARAV